MQAIRLRAWNAGVMQNVARAVASAVIVTLLLPVGVADGQGRARLYQLRFDGYVGSPPENRHEQADLLLRAGKKDVRFQVTNATVLSGNISVGQVFSSVRPRRPNFILRGQPPLIAQVEDATPGTRLRIMGAWRPGSRDFLVSSIAPQPAVEAQPSGEQQPPAENQPSR